MQHISAQMRAKSHSVWLLGCVCVCEGDRERERERENGVLEIKQKDNYLSIIYQFMFFW